MSRETKTVHFNVKATGTTTNDKGQRVGLIEAYGAVFNNVDDGNDRIVPGAFDRTIKNNKARADARKREYIIPMLWQHDTHEQIGSWYDMTADSFGLLCKGHVLLATKRGEEYYELAFAGMTDQFSIIYDVMAGGATYDKAGVRNLSELRLFSVDPVTFAMNDETYLVGVKARETSDKERQAMNPKEAQRKTLMQHYNQEAAQDLLEDWQDVYLCSLTSAVLDALKIGDTMQSDISQALDDFKTLVMSTFVSQAESTGLPQYLTDNAYSSADSTMQNGSDSGYGWMSSMRRMTRKAGRAISAANSDAIQGAADAMHGIADDHMTYTKAMVKSMHSAADDLATVLQGSEGAYGDDNGSPDPGAQEGKRRTARITEQDDNVVHALKELKLLRNRG